MIFLSYYEQLAFTWNWIKYADIVDVLLILSEDKQT